MNYQQAAAKALKEFDYHRRATVVKKIENTAQFRQLTVYESSGTGTKLSHVLFGLQFCSEEGDNYRELMISVDELEFHHKKSIVTDLRLYTIQKI